MEILLFVSNEQQHTESEISILDFPLSMVFNDEGIIKLRIINAIALLSAVELKYMYMLTKPAIWRMWLAKAAV